MWEVETGRCLATLEGHTGSVGGVALSGDGRRALSGSKDLTVRVWEVETGRCLATLEDRDAGRLNRVAPNGDGQHAVTRSEVAAGRVRLATDPLAILEGNKDAVGVALSGDGRRALSAIHGGEARIWSMPALEIVPLQPESSDDARYTNAKVLFVGNTGVGKTGLTFRIAKDCFQDSMSTDAAWVTHLPLPQQATKTNLEREIWLWDFAGQADYRLIHQLFMDETALAVLVFNPQSENPFEGLGQWSRDIRRTGAAVVSEGPGCGQVRPRRIDGSRSSVDDFLRERDYACYLKTSKGLGEGMCGIAGGDHFEYPFRTKFHGPRLHASFGC